ncbi:MAG: cyclic nucleotide-binding domain-containing protein [Myxococcota bacterium]|nr:cyclic nucleotide-binding domain-containing protein [Myxococcota bacterium]
MSRKGLARFSLLSDLSPDDLACLEGHLDDRAHPAGFQVFAEGQEADGMWLVRRGKLRIESQRAGSLSPAGPGSALGALSLVAVGPRESSAIVDADAQLWFLSRTAFRELASEAPQTACRLLEGMLRDTAGSLREGLDRLS